MYDGLFFCFLQNIPEQDTKIIPTAIEYAIHIDLIAIYPVESEIISMHKKTVITFDIGN